MPRRYTREELAEGLASVRALEEASARWDAEATLEAALSIRAGQPAFLWTAGRGLVRYDTLAALAADRGTVFAQALAAAWPEPEA
jgi:hypothetical protein